MTPKAMLNATILLKNANTYYSLALGAGGTN
jgi:hypothetical protein